jgi:hypothetical protein
MTHEGAWRAAAMLQFAFSIMIMVLLPWWPGLLLAYLSWHPGVTTTRTTQALCNECFACRGTRA